MISWAPSQPSSSGILCSVYHPRHESKDTEIKPTLRCTPPAEGRGRLPTCSPLFCRTWSTWPGWSFLRCACNDTNTASNPGQATGHRAPGCAASRRPAGGCGLREPGPEGCLEASEGPAPAPIPPSAPRPRERLPPRASSAADGRRPPPRRPSGGNRAASGRPDTASGQVERPYSPPCTWW